MNNRNSLPLVFSLFLAGSLFFPIISSAQDAPEIITDTTIAPTLPSTGQIPFPAQSGALIPPQDTPVDVEGDTPIIPRGTPQIGGSTPIPGSNVPLRSPMVVPRISPPAAQSPALTVPPTP